MKPRRALFALLATGALLASGPTWAGTAIERALAGFWGKDFTTARAELAPLVAKGDAEALYHLGVAELNGEGGPVDAAKAYQLFQQSAEHGFALAVHNMADMHRTGTGVPQDWAKASAGFCAAAEMGVIESMASCAMTYYQGTGVPKDMEKANYWFRMADAYQYNLTHVANFYFSDEAEDRQMEKTWRRLAKEGNVEANYRLGRMILNTNGPVKDMLGFFRVAAEGGHPLAMLRMGQASFQSAKIEGGFPPDYPAAKMWLSKAALAGEPMSLAILAKLVRDGKIGTVDNSRAYALFTLSLWKGHIWVTADRHKLYKGMSEAELDAADALVTRCRTDGLAACGILD